MENFMAIMKTKVKELDLSPDKTNSILEKDCYIGAFLLGFIEYLQNIKIDSLVQFTEKLEKGIFNKKLVEELTKAQIIPKNSVAISLEAVIDELQYIIKKYTSQKDLPKELSTILKELILKAQKLFIFYSSGKKEIAKNFNKSIHKDSKIFVYGYSNDVICR